MDNFFNLFAIPQKYGIDLEALNASYFAMQESVHPDRQRLSDSSNNISATINNGYVTLTNPLKRAKHLLQVNGYKTDELTQGNAQQMFDIRMQYENLKNEHNNSKNEHAIALFTRRLQEQMDKIIADLYKIEDDLDAFFNLFKLAEFINSFLEKVNTDVYNRN